MPGGVGGAVSDGRPYPDLFLVALSMVARIFFVTIMTR